MFVVVTYDISEDSRRIKVARLLERYGERIQLSVFECVVTAGQLRALMERMRRRVSPADGVRYYVLCDKCRGRAMVLGDGRLTADPSFYVI